MNRFLAGCFIFALAVWPCTIASAQSDAVAAPSQGGTSLESSPGLAYSPEMLRLIEMEEAAARSNEASHGNRNNLIVIYVSLGNLYENAGMYLKAENAMQRAIALMKNGPQHQLAGELGQLAALHVQMGNSGQAERDEMRALRIRQAVGDPVGMALTWSDFGSIYNQEHKFKKALDYSQRAYDVLANRTDVNPDERIAIRLSLGFALTAVQNCDQGIPMLKDAVDLSISSLGAGNSKLGYPEYILGFGYWHCGDRGHAADWLQRGTTDMKANFGWERSLYLNAMRQYARFLRQNGEPEEAMSAEAVVNQANAVVDVRTLTGMSEGFRSAGSR